MFNDDTVLPRRAQEELLLALEPQAADVDAQRLRRRIRARIDSIAPIRAVRRDDGWKPMAPGLERKLLFDDGSSTSWLLRLAPGAVLPEHVHDDGVEECLVLEGEVSFAGDRYGPGDYMVAAQGSHHAVTRSVGGATMFLPTPSRHAGAGDYARLR